MSVFPGGGGLGVAFFFVLGGFAMTLGYHQKVMQPEFSYSSYLAKRAVKFYPLHWLCLLAALPLCIESFSWITFTINAALLHSWVPREDFYFSYNMVSWYLANTLVFTAVFPFLFRGMNSLNKQTKWITGILIVLVSFFGVQLIPLNKQHAILYINPIARLLDFIVGIFAGLLFLKMKENKSVKMVFDRHAKLFNWLVFVCIATVVVMAFVVFLMGVKICPPLLLWPLILTIIFITSLLGVFHLSGSVISNKWLIQFGEYSFPFFMLHQIIIRYVYKFIRPSLCMLTENRYLLQVMLIIVCFIITLIATILIQNYINKPVTQWLTRKIQPSTTAQ